MTLTRTEKDEKYECKPTPEIDIPLYESPVPPSPTISVRKIPNQYKKIVVDGPSVRTLKLDMTVGTGTLGMVIVKRSMQRRMACRSL
jgi:hypothetical protein